MGIKTLTGAVLGLTGVFITLKVLNRVDKMMEQYEMEQMVDDIQKEIDQMNHEL